MKQEATVDLVGLILEEYKLLRSEVLLSLERTVTILSYGLGAIGVLVGAALTGLRQDVYLASAVVCAVIIPLTSGYVFHIWAAEKRRGRRVSHYLWELELKLERACEAQDIKLHGLRPLEWEQRIRAKRDTPYGLYYDHYQAVARWCGVIAASSLFFGLVLALQTATTFLSAPQLQGGRTAAALTGFVTYALLNKRYMRTVRWLHDAFDVPPELPTRVDAAKITELSASPAGSLPTGSHSAATPNS